MNPKTLLESIWVYFLIILFSTLVMLLLGGVLVNLMAGRLFLAMLCAALLYALFEIAIFVVRNY